MPHPSHSEIATSPQRAGQLGTESEATTDWHQRSASTFSVIDIEPPLQRDCGLRLPESESGNSCMNSVEIVLRAGFVRHRSNGITRRAVQASIIIIVIAFDYYCVLQGHHSLSQNTFSLFPVTLMGNIMWGHAHYHAQDVGGREMASVDTNANDTLRAIKTAFTPLQ